MNDVLELSSITTEYIRVPVSAKVLGAVVDPTSYPLSFAAVAQATEPEDLDYSEGAWDSDVEREVYFAQWLVTGMTDGRYDLWIRIQASPEDIKRKVGVLVIT